MSSAARIVPARSVTASCARDRPIATTRTTPDEFAKAWDVVIDTSGAADSAATLAAGSTFELDTRTVVVLQEHAEPEAEPDHSVAASVAALSQATATPAADQRSGSRPTKAPDA